MRSKPFLASVFGVAVVAIGHFAVAGQPFSNDASLSSFSLSELVAKLGTEGPRAESATLESDTNHLYDTVVEEILQRREIAVLPFLLDRVNDDTVIRGPEGAFLWGCRYDTPIRVKYKVRFILLRLLHPSDFNAMIGDPSASVVDVDKARSYLERHRDEIVGRLR